MTHDEHSLREGGQDAVEMLGMLSMADEIVLADISDEDLLTWFIENRSRETGLIREFATAIGEEAWSAAAGLVYAEHVERAAALARGLVEDPDGEFVLDLLFSLESADVARMTDWDLTSALIEEQHITSFTLLRVGADFVCEGVVSDQDSDVLIYGATVEYGHESQTLSVKNDEGSARILLTGLEMWEAMAAS